MALAEISICKNVQTVVCQFPSSKNIPPGSPENLSLSIAFLRRAVLNKDMPEPAKRRKLPPAFLDIKELVSREALDALRGNLRTSKHFPSDPEPDWKSLRRQFSARGTMPVEGHSLAVACMERLWLLPFHRYDTCSALIVFYFSDFLELEFKAVGDADAAVLCKAFHVLVAMLLQGVSGFPGEPHLVAEDLRRALESPSAGARAQVLPLARLFAASEDGVCGANRYLAVAPDEIALFEHRARRGDYDSILKSDYKMRSYEQSLTANRAFYLDWETLEADFDGIQLWEASGIMRRSRMVESTAAPHPHPKDRRAMWQAAFDVFCWKWFLYGMQRADPCDLPLVQKVTCSFGPYGTTIFIPGYWSLDAHRDIRWAEVAKLHASRGVPKRGEKLDINRAGSLDQARKAQQANIEARSRGLRSEKRMDFIKQQAGLDLRTEDSHVRRLLRKKLS